MADEQGAIPEGMKAWAGGESAPADWAGPGSVSILRNGYRVKGGYRWTHHSEDRPAGTAGTDIIAYTPAADRLTDTGDYDVVGWAKAMSAKGGPHEWGYRDVATGEFIHDEWPFFAVEYIAALATHKTADAGAMREAADYLDQYAQFIRDEVKADDLERHPYLPALEQVAAAIRNQSDAGEPL